MKPKSLKINAFLNTIRSLLSMIFPLITFPYVSRVLGAKGLGIYNFSNSVVSYFLLLAGLGISTYAVREGAKSRDNKEKMSQFASQIFSINLLSTIFSYLLLLLTVLLYSKLHSYLLCILIFSLQIIFTTLGTEWLYSIYEDYTYITIRSIAFNILSILLLFLFVKNRNDYLTYAGITVLANVGSNILNFIHGRKICNIRFTTSMNLKIHLKPIIIIFASNLSILIFVNSDMTLLGIMRSAYIVGIYSVSVKIYSVLKTILSASLIVTVPRLAALYGKKKFNEYQRTASNIFNYLILITIPAMMGLFMISNDVIVILSGKSFIAALPSLRILCIALIFSISGWFYSECVLIPAKLEKIVLISTSFSALLNIVLNLLMIPYFSENAAAFSTVIAELANMIIMIVYGRKIVHISYFRKNFFSVCIASIGICISCKIVKSLNLGYILETVLCVISSVIVYVALLLLLKNKVLIKQLILLKAKI